MTQQDNVNWLREHYDGPKKSMTCKACGAQVAIGWLKRHAKICLLAEGGWITYDPGKEGKFGGFKVVQDDSKGLPTITSVPCKCPQCDWRGCVGDCEPDVDGDGSLGCPRCFTIISVGIPDTWLHRALRRLALWMNDVVYRGGE